MANGYSSESTQQELSNEYQYDRVKMIIIFFCFFVDWTKIISAVEGLIEIKVTKIIKFDLSDLLEAPT